MLRSLGGSVTTAAAKAARLPHGACTAAASAANLSSVAAEAAKQGSARLNLVIRSYDVTALNTFLRMLPTGQGGKGMVRLPKKIKRWTVNRSPHVHSKSKETFERITHRVLIPIREPNIVTLRWITAIRDAGIHANVAFKLEVVGGGDPASDAAGRRKRDKYTLRHSLAYRRAREKELAALHAALLADARRRIDEGVTLAEADALSPRHADAAAWLAELDRWELTGTPPQPELHRVEALTARAREYAPVWLEAANELLEQHRSRIGGGGGGAGDAEAGGGSSGAAAAAEDGAAPLLSAATAALLEEWAARIDAWLAFPSRTPAWLVDRTLWRRLEAAVLELE
ncbi:hypothetical protein JKP88DRAFT_200752, partial [Tribonema minus]